MPTSQSARDDYVETVAERLTAEGFDRSSATVADQSVTVLHERSFQPLKFGLVDTVVVVGSAETADEAAAFSEAAFDYGLELKSPLPRGLGGNLVVYPVLVTDADLGEWIAEYEPKHWSSFEFPVVVDPGAGTVDYDTATPLWGGLYYRGFRRRAEKTLAP